MCRTAGCNLIQPCFLALFVQTRVQMLAGLEEGDDLARDFDCGSRSRVPAGASLAMLERDGAEAAYLDASTPRKCSADLLEDGIDNARDIAVPKI